jgi:cell shape-determining protein MreD
MKGLHTIAILGAAFLTVFIEAQPGGVRHRLGVQVDLLPALVVYAALTADLATVTLLAVFGGLWFDSLSANPFGISILPLFVAGVVIQRNQELVLRDQAYARVVLGLLASSFVPVTTFLLMSGTSAKPIVNAGTLWQWLVMTIAGGLFTPVWFWCFGRLRRLFSYPTMPEHLYRRDRVIKRPRRI